MRYLKIPLLLLALAGLLAFAGCGGDDDESTSAVESSTTESASTATDASSDPAADEFGQELGSVLGESIAGLSSLQTISQAKTPEEFTGQIEEADTQIQTTIDDLGALEAPEAAQGAQDQIIAAYENFSEKLSGVGDAVASEDKNSIKQAASDLTVAGTDFQSDLQSAAQSLQEAGVTVPSGG